MDFVQIREQREVKADEQTEALAARVIGACIEVHRHLGPGLPEKVYREALSHELTLQNIRHACEVPVPMYYKGRLVGEGRIDTLVEDVLVVEIKVVEVLNNVHRA